LAPGTPSPETLRGNITAVYTFLIQVARIRSDHIFVFGRSIGTGIALDFCVSVGSALGGLILLSPFTSIRAVTDTAISAKMGGWTPPVFGFLLSERYDSVSNIAQVRCPTLLLHGEDDGVIPASHSEHLHEASGASINRLRLFEHMNHGNCTDFADPIVLEIQELLGAETPRAPRKGIAFCNDWPHGLVKQQQHFDLGAMASHCAIEAVEQDDACEEARDLVDQAAGIGAALLAMLGVDLQANLMREGWAVEDRPTRRGLEPLQGLVRVLQKIGSEQAAVRYAMCCGSLALGLTIASQQLQHIALRVCAGGMRRFTHTGWPVAMPRDEGEDSASPRNDRVSSLEEDMEAAVEEQRGAVARPCRSGDAWGEEALPRRRPTEWEETRPRRSSEDPQAEVQQRFNAMNRLLERAVVLLFGVTHHEPPPITSLAEMSSAKATLEHLDMCFNQLDGKLQEASASDGQQQISAVIKGLEAEWRETYMGYHNANRGRAWLEREKRNLSTPVSLMGAACCE